MAMTRREAPNWVRRMDPEWLFSLIALAALYREVENGSMIACVNIAVINDDGSVTTYGVNRHAPGDVYSVLVTDQDAVAEGIERGMVQTSVGAVSE